MGEFKENLMSLSDESKLDYIKNMEINDHERENIAKSIKSDEIKLQSLQFFDNDYSKIAIIITLESDKNKIEAMKQHIKERTLYIEVIQSLSLEEEKLANLFLLPTPHKEKILEDIKVENDEKRIYVATCVDDDYLAFTYIKDIEDEEKKIKAIDLLDDETLKKEIIMTIDEGKRLSLLNKVENLALKDEIIFSITDDNIKIEYFNKISDRNLKSRILASIESDEYKLEQLRKLKTRDEIDYILVIASLKSDEEKLNQLKNIKDEKNRTIIQMSLKDRKKIVEAFLDKDRMYSKIGLDTGITIGIEIECEGAMSSDIQTIDMIKKRNNGEKTKDWKVVEDSSLKNGIEIVSPILTDNEENIEKIYIICSMLQKCGQYTNERCGGHVHIGSDFLKSKEAYINLLEIWGNTEKIMYKISNEKGNIPRIKIGEFAIPISTKLEHTIEDKTVNLEDENDLNAFINKIQSFQTDKYYGMNLLNINNGKNTIEFRISNGTINPNSWIDNIRLYGRMIQISQKLAEIEKSQEQSDEDKRLLYLKDKLKEEISEQEKMEILLELLFSEEEKNIYRERYFSNSKLLEQLQNDEENPLKKSKFSQVDFHKKHTLDEFRDVAINDRTDDINEVTRETIEGVQEEIQQIDDKYMEEK